MGMYFPLVLPKKRKICELELAKSYFKLTITYASWRGGECCGSFLIPQLMKVSLQFVIINYIGG